MPLIRLLLAYRAKRGSVPASAAFRLAVVAAVAPVRGRPPPCRGLALRSRTARGGSPATLCIVTPSCPAPAAALRSRGPALRSRCRPPPRRRPAGSRSPREPETLGIEGIQRPVAVEVQPPSVADRR